MNDQWPQQISFNANHIEATASYVRDTQMNKTLPLLLRKCISMDFQKKKKKGSITFINFCSLPPTFMPVKGLFWCSLGFV